MAADAADHRRYRRWSRPGNAIADRVLPPLTASASHGRLWLALAGFLATTGRTRRQSAATALTALSLASATSNVLANHLVERPRCQRPSRAAATCCHGPAQDELVSQRPQRQRRGIRYRGGPGRAAPRRSSPGDRRRSRLGPALHRRALPQRHRSRPLARRYQCDHRATRSEPAATLTQPSGSPEHASYPALPD